MLTSIKNKTKATTQGFDYLHRGSNQSGMRAYNERLVLTLVRKHKALSKTDIAYMTGLSTQTVSVIMRQLEADGLLQPDIPIRGKVGRPSIPMKLSPDGAYFFGMKLGRRSADLVLIDFLGSLLGQVHHTYHRPVPKDMISFAKDAIKELLSCLSSQHQSRIAGLGIAMPFQLWNWNESTSPPQTINTLETWQEWDIRSSIAVHYGFPVYLQNDASAACGAELVFGQPVINLQNFLYFYIGFFVGGGIVLKGSLYTGRSGNAGALGSIPVPDNHGSVCQLIDVASIATLSNTLKAVGEPSSRLWETSDKWSIDSNVLTRWINTVGKGLAYAIVSSTSVIDFEATVIDGWLPSSVRADIVQSTRNHLETMNFAGINTVELLEGTVGYNARALGGAAIPLTERFLLDQNAFLKDK